MRIESMDLTESRIVVGAPAGGAVAVPHKYVQSVGSSNWSVHPNYDGASRGEWRHSWAPHRPPDATRKAPTTTTTRQGRGVHPNDHN